ncbi:unnamed protein product [Closterium sp. Naga37s-1]|nr:unnamed protein product [Closterium sp. Naga37s-1]
MRAVEDDGTLPQYSQDELRRATCDWRTKLGEGGFGAVYKGMLLLPSGGARGGGYGGGDGGRDHGGDGGGWDERDHEEEVQGGMGPGINDDLEVVQVGGKEFVPVAVKMCLTDNAEGGAREQLLVNRDTVMTALHHPNILRLLGVAKMGRTIRRPPPQDPPAPTLLNGERPEGRTHCRDAPPLSSPLPSSPSPPLRHFHPVSPPSPLPHQTEVMMMTAVHHPNILRLLGVAVMGQTLAMVSEFVPGGDVSQRLKKGTGGWNAVECGGHVRT